MAQPEPADIVQLRHTAGRLVSPSLDTTLPG